MYLLIWVMELIDLGDYVGLRVKEEMISRGLSGKDLANSTYELLGFKSPISARDYIRSVREGCFHVGPKCTKSMRLKRLSEMLSFFNLTENDEIILKIKLEYPEFKYNLNNNYSIYSEKS